VDKLHAVSFTKTSLEEFLRNYSKILWLINVAAKRKEKSKKVIANYANSIWFTIFQFLIMEKNLVLESFLILIINIY
jgi:hypothetical protein